MGQLYVPEGTWALCSNGKKTAKLHVTSQATIRIEGGKLAATEHDRFDGNFVCPPMMAAGALAGAAFAAAFVASGPALVAFVGGAVGALAGGTVLANHLPSVCSLLCHGSEWTALHAKVKFEKKKALLQKATLSCTFGGLITLKMPNYEESIDAGLLAGNLAYPGDPLMGLTEQEKSRVAAYHKLNDKEIANLGLNPKLFRNPVESHYNADLFRKDGKYVLVFRGTVPTSIEDDLQDLTQGVGLKSDYFDKSVTLADQMKRIKDKNGNLIFNANNITIAGHSLGGGMAAIAGGASGFPTYTYNAAGVHDVTLERNNVHRADMNHVQAYNGSSDPLNAAQDVREGILSSMGFVGRLVNVTGGLPRAAGERMELETGLPLQGVGGGHSAINVVRALEKEAAVSASQTVIAQMR